MGYRSEVIALFYVTGLPSVFNKTTKQYEKPDPDGTLRQKAESTFKFWWAANCRGSEGGFFDTAEEPPYFRPLRSPSLGYMFKVEHVKWDDSYPAVREFNAFVERFRNDLCGNKELDNGSGLHMCFAYEFIRLGEEDDDIERDYTSNSAFDLSVERRICVDVEAE